MGNLIKITPRDNVGIVAHLDGLPMGTDVGNGVVLSEAIPMGHKVALSDLSPGDEVLRYGEVIGHAAQPIRKGEWVIGDKITMPRPPDLNLLSKGEEIIDGPAPSISGYTFEGFRNRDGSVGTKNILAISTSVQCVAGMSRYVEEKIRRELLPRYPNVDDVVTISHHYGCGVAIDAPAAIIPIRTLQNIARNPNFGGEVLVIGLGCEKLRPERLFPPGQSTDHSPAGDLLYLQDERFRSFSDMVSGIMDLADRHLRRLNAKRRETCPASVLVVGMQCGGSDSFSGITGNPVAGFAADLIVRAGGTVFFSEVTEVRDAIHLLVRRASSVQVAEALIQEMAWYDDYLARGGADRSANPTPGNRRGGLSNVVEKALGSVAKSGTSPIIDVVGPGERVRKKGLNFVATPASDFVCGTLQLAAGMNLHVFITGRGTPYGLSVVPVVKVSSNSKLGSRWSDLIDFDAGPIAHGQKTIEEMGWELFHQLLAVASGDQKVAADRLGLHNDLVLFNPGPIT